MHVWMGQTVDKMLKDPKPGCRFRGVRGKGRVLLMPPAHTTTQRWAGHPPARPLDPPHVRTQLTTPHTQGASQGTRYSNLFLLPQLQHKAR